MTPENNTKRLETIRKAGNALALSIFPATGYNPEKIGNALADSIMEALQDCPIELDLGHECLSLVMSATLSRLNEHYEEIANKSKFSEMTFPAPSYDGEENETL
jgi:hypothetical protein